MNGFGWFALGMLAGVLLGYARVALFGWRKLTLIEIVRVLRRRVDRGSNG